MRTIHRIQAGGVQRMIHSVNLQDCHFEKRNHTRTAMDGDFIIRHLNCSQTYPGR
jgi:hypothetical protein